VITFLAAAVLTPSDFDSRRPDFVVTSYQQVEVLGRDGLPDFAAKENHWQKITEKYFIVRDSHTGQRQPDGCLTLQAQHIGWVGDPDTVTQTGVCPASMSGKFKWIGRPAGTYPSAGSGGADFQTQKVVAGGELVEVVIESGVEEVERRTVDHQTCTRTQTRNSYSFRVVGMGRGDQFNPVRPDGMWGYTPVTSRPYPNR
jgi:hypothetical protein